MMKKNRMSPHVRRRLDMAMFGIIVMCVVVCHMGEATDTVDTDKDTANKECDCDEKVRTALEKESQMNNSKKDPDLNSLPVDSPLHPLHALDKPEWGDHRLAVVVPFRDRLEELLEFVPYMHAFLDAQHVRHKFFIVNQVDTLRFNRGLLINVGFLQAEKECDYFAMHDVDLLPQSSSISYAYPEHGPVHLAAPVFKDLYKKSHVKHLGGIMLMTNHQMHKISGMSTKFWGWGDEDVELFRRLNAIQLNAIRPGGKSSDFKEIPTFPKRPKDLEVQNEQRQSNRFGDHVTGLTYTKYKIEKQLEMTLGGVPLMWLNVRLHCNLRMTPWCITPEQQTEINNHLRHKYLRKPEKYQQEPLSVSWDDVDMPERLMKHARSLEQSKNGA